MKIIYFAAMVFLLWPGKTSAVILAKNGKAKTVIVVAPNATAPENYAAHELAAVLKQITGATFNIRTNTVAPSHAILVGQSSSAENLGGEEWTIRSEGNRLWLAGGGPRGTLYAVSRFLQDECGVRWWTPWASRVPQQRTLQITNLNLRGRPAFEYREPYWFDAFDGNWCWENLCNSQFGETTAEQGGKIKYKGFVHTFYKLVPPDKYFADHPEWFSLVNGKRVNQNAQLCTTNPKLRDFMVEQVRQRLRESPDTDIISVSQNDCFGACECTNCKAIDDAQGSQAATMISLVNYIADEIRAEFPHVAVDTLAYQYTRHPPHNLRPRPNVIVRLCSIECNFREPLESPVNSSFGNDIRGWAQQAGRLYIWDYVTDFAHYLQPNPNWFVLGPNLRFFQTNHVRGVFEEGAYESHGAEMAELRAWVLAQLLVNPNQDDHALIREFLEGYYGAAGKPIERYMDLMQDASKGYNLTCGVPTDAPFLHFKTLAAAEKIWQEAEQSVASNDDLLARVRLGHLSIQYVWLSQWNALRRECVQGGVTWPLNESRQTVADQWRVVADGVPGKPWTKVTVLREGGQTAENFLSSVQDGGK